MKVIDRRTRDTAVEGELAEVAKLVGLCGGEWVGVSLDTGYRIELDIPEAKILLAGLRESLGER